MRRRQALGGLGIGLLAGRAAAQPAPRPLARYPAGTFLENLILRADGSVLFTNYFARRIEMWSAAGGAALFTAVPAHPVSLAALPAGGYALVTHGAVFTQGPATMRGMAAVFVLDAGGRVQRRLPLPEAIFPNGCLLLSDGRLLIADSALGLVWALDLASGEAPVWLRHAALAPDPARPGVPGVNGIKAQPGEEGRVIRLSNSASRELLLAMAGSDGAWSMTQLAIGFPGIDDFWIMPDGVVWAATHGPVVARSRPGAAPEAFAAPGLEGNTALVPAPDGSGLYVLGTGGLAEGGRGEAMLALLPWPG